MTTVMMLAELVAWGLSGGTLGLVTVPVTVVGLAAAVPRSTRNWGLAIAGSAALALFLAALGLVASVRIPVN